MSQVKWTNGSGGDFANGANWSTGTVPGAADDAVFMLAGPYTVTSAQGETVNSVQMVAGVTLSITGGTFDAANGSGSGSDNGVIAIGNNTEFQAGGTIAGTGTIQMNSAGNGTDLTVLDSGLTLSGGGKVVLSDNGQNYVRALNGGDKLTNVNDTISGAGQFAYGNMSFANGAAGVLNGSAANNALVVNAGTGTITNAGLFEATGAGGLDILNSTVTQTGTGTIKAVGAGHNVSLDGGSIVGGTLTTTGGGMIQSVSNGYLTNVSITAGSTIAALNDEYLHVSGTITNKGTIALDSAGNGTRLQVDSGTLTLTGAGAVILTDNSQNYIFAGTSADLLVNLNNTISGAGQLTYNYLAFDNRAAGVIDATGTSNALVVDTGGSAFSNEGLMEDTGAGGLAITDGTVIANAGTILAAGAGSHVDLNTGTIRGGTLKTTGGGVIQSVNNFGLDGSTKLGAITITANSQVAVLNDEYLTLAGTIVNGGTIALDSAGNGTRLQVNGTVDLTGGGTVALSDNTQNYLYSVNQTDTLVNVDNVITGSGQMAYNYLTVDNQVGGTIDATGAAGMTLDSGGRAFLNEGLVEDTGSGGFTVTDGTVITNAGTVLATGAGASVDLSNGTIAGGTVATAKGGVIEVTSANGGLDGSSNGAVDLTTGSQVQVANNGYLFVEGTIANHGTIGLDSAGNGTRLEVNGTVTLTGGGAVTLSDNSQNYFYSQNQNDTLINVNDTITGSGSLTYNYLHLDNQAAGVIDSTGTVGMVFDNPQAGNVTNEGLIEDTGTGGITLVNGAVIDNTGTILATGTGYAVDLSSGTIAGGTVATANGGVVQVTNYGTLDGQANGTLTIAAGSQVAVLNDEFLTIDGTIANHGTIALDSAGNGTRLQVSGTATLTGGGAVTLSDNNQNYFYSVNQTDTLVNANDVITGSGQMMYNDLSIDNQAKGVFDANGTAGMTFNSGGRTLTNEGTLEASGTGGIFIQATTLTNTGTMLAANSTITVNADAPLTNYNAGKLTGGTYEAIATGKSATATIALNSIGTIGTDGATLVLSGAGAAITAGGTAVQATITAITATGALEYMGGIGGTDTLALANAGLLLVSGGKLTLDGPSFSNTGTVQVGGGGTLAVTKTDGVAQLSKGTLAGGTWAVSGNGSVLSLGSGTVGSDAATITLSGAGSVFQSGSPLASLEKTLTAVTGKGVLNVLGGRGFAAAKDISDAGTITLGGGTFSSAGLTIAGVFDGTGTLAGPVTDNGTLTTGGPGTGTLTLADAVSGTGLLAATAHDTLVTDGYAVGSVNVAAGGTLVGAGSATGAIAIAGTLSMAGGTLSGGSVATGAGGLLTGEGTVATSVANGGTIDAAGGTLTLSAGESGGALGVENGAALVASAAIGAASLSIAAGGSFQGFGSVSGATTDTGSLTASGGTLALATLAGSGSATIAGGSALDLGNPLTLGGGLTFGAGGSETLGLAGPSGNTTTLSGFGTGDVIDVAGATITKVSYKKGVLTLYDGKTKLGRLDLSGSYTSKNFALHSDGSGGTDIDYKAGGKMAADPLADLRQQAAALPSPYAAGAAPAADAASAFPGPQEPHSGWVADGPAFMPHVGDVLPHVS